VGSTEASFILKVNPRTVARWADDGTLPLAELTESGFRRFHRSTVEALAAQMAGAA
jgi:DNA-binding transcriptional MerR regulator